MIHLIEVAHAGVITDAPTFQKIGMNILSFLLSVIGIIAIMSLLVSGTAYFFSAGDEAKMQFAKKSAKYAILGIILSLGGMVLVKLIGGFFG
jgi:hypothetical protein